MPKPTSLLKGFERYVSDPMKKPEAAKAIRAGKRALIFDEATTGLALVVSPKGKRTFSIVARDPLQNNKQIWAKIGDPALMSVSEARIKAAQAVARVKAGEAPLPAPERPKKAPETFQQVWEKFQKLHLATRGERYQDEVQWTMDLYVLPEWADRIFTDVKRRDVADLLDKIQFKQAGPNGDKGGPSQADHTLAYLSSLFSWYQARDDDFISPIVRGMKRTKASSRARKRFLTDDEIRTLWAAADKSGTYGALVKVALLTGARREKVSTMRWEDISEGLWTIPIEPNEKPHAGELKLPKLALDIIAAQPEIVGNPYVFAGRGKKAINSFSKNKREFDKLAPIDPWVFHDLRRTAKSLMARAGVRSDISERVLGHKIGGVEGVYDRYSYDREKTEALEALASLVARILAGEQDNVVQLEAVR